MLEPRGHENMFGAILVDPTDPAADIGAIFLDAHGYLNMCGHGSIAIAKIAIEFGLSIPRTDHNQVTIENFLQVLSLQECMKKEAKFKMLLFKTFLHSYTKVKFESTHLVWEIYW